MPARATPAVHPLSDVEMKERSGRSWDDWFTLLDQFGGPSKGRRAIGDLLIEKHKLDAWLASTLNVEYEAARGIVEKDGRPKGYMICATKTIVAPAASAFEAWSSASAWNTWFTSAARVDFREGGRFSTGDGDAGQFTRIRENKAIRFTWENPKHTPGTTVEVTFSPKGADKCTVMVAHDRIQSRADADDLREAWGNVLGALKSRLES